MAGLWITPAELPDDLGDTEYAMEACESASFILWAMSGRKFSGPVTVTEKYGKDLPIIIDQVVALGLPFTAMDLISSALPEYVSQLRYKLLLRGRPVKDILSVVDTYSAETVDPSHYSLENHSTLVFDHYLTRELEVTYTYGGSIPAAAKMAARALATQFALLWGGRQEECTLPDRVVSINRQDVSWVLLDNQDFIADLRTGIYAVDLFLKSVNPHKATQRAKVFSPDVPRGRRTTPIGGFGGGGFGN